LIIIKTIENDDNLGRRYRSVICFRDHRNPRAFVYELFRVTSINQDVLFAIKFKILKYL